MGTIRSTLKAVTISQAVLSKLSQYRILAKLLLADPLKRTACKNLESSSTTDNGGDPSQITSNQEGTVERQNLFLFTDDCWAPSSELTVSLIEPVPRNRNFDVKRLIEWCAAEWTRGVDLSFLFLDKGDPSRSLASVRIAFQAGFTHSVVGAQRIAAGLATMNLGIGEGQSEPEARRMILHEFGHALGFRHEHTSPRFPFRFNKDVVIRDMAQRLRKGVEEAAADFEINFERDRTGKKVEASEFDAASIMMYHLYSHWHTGQVDLPQSFGLSATDKAFVVQVYGPAPGTNRRRYDNNDFRCDFRLCRPYGQGPCNDCKIYQMRQPQ